MRLPRSPADAAILSTLLFPFLSAAAGNIVCDNIRVDGVAFDLSELGGPRSVMHSVDNGISFTNTTYTIDICKPLRKVKNIPKQNQCPNGTRVCGIQRSIQKEDWTEVIDKFIPIAGELKDREGGDLNAKYVRLKNSPSHADSEKEGVRIELNGGFVPKDGGKRKQKAIIEFICDPERTGLEHLWDPEDKYDAKAKRAEGDTTKDDSNSSSLQFFSYDTDKGDEDILRLSWLTKHACEDSKDKEDAEKSSHWGFFTWFIIIAFLSTATYLIFGSWLNYNRFGSRGWDLLPHGDTIRDIPYLFKDWMRRVLKTVQGSDSRGGYAAV